MMDIFSIIFLLTGEGKGPKIIKLYSCSTELSLKFQLINIKIPTNKEVSCLSL